MIEAETWICLLGIFGSLKIVLYFYIMSHLFTSCSVMIHERIFIQDFYVPNIILIIFISETPVTVQLLVISLK